MRCATGAPRASVARLPSTRICAAPRSVTCNAASPGLAVDLRGKKAFIAGVADDQGFGWAIAKSLYQAGAEISLGVWVSRSSRLRRHTGYKMSLDHHLPYISWVRHVK
eukprot:361306-Chlamydomonas_euryale.AAC.4